MPLRARNGSERLEDKENGKNARSQCSRRNRRRDSGDVAKRPSGHWIDSLGCDRRGSLWAPISGGSVQVPVGHGHSCGGFFEAQLPIALLPVFHQVLVSERLEAGNLDSPAVGSAIGPMDLPVRWPPLDALRAHKLRIINTMASSLPAILTLPNVSLRHVDSELSQEAKIEHAKWRESAKDHSTFHLL